MEERSYFDGGLLQLIGWLLLGSLITIFTLGICFPWAICMVYSWEAKHTVIDGKRLVFDGSAVGLFGNWIKWLFFCIITLGIYSFWVEIASATASRMSLRCLSLSSVKRLLARFTRSNVSFSCIDFVLLVLA